MYSNRLSKCKFVNNHFWRLYNAEVIVMFDAGTIPKTSFTEFIQPLTPMQVEKNIKKLEALFSIENRLADLINVSNNLCAFATYNNTGYL